MTLAVNAALLLALVVGIILGMCIHELMEGWREDD